MNKSIDVVFDGKVFVPSEPVGLEPGTRMIMTFTVAALSEREAEAKRDLDGEGQNLPWATIDEAISYSRARPGYHLLPVNDKPIEDAM